MVAASARTTARTSPGTDEPALAAVVEARSTATDISDPPLVELTPPPAHHRVALTTRAAPADLRYELPPPDVTRRQGKLKRNEFIATILTDAGATLVAQDELFRSLRGKFDFRYAQPGQRYRLAVDHRGKVVSFEFRADVDEIYRVRRTEADALVAKRVEVPLKREVVEVDGNIKTSLWDAFVDAGESPALAMSLADAFQYDIDFFHDTRSGDRFRLFVEKFSNAPSSL
ncbi:MAG: hypothetical protein AAGK78_07675, partial [Planctomycetota bacterium]